MDGFRGRPGVLKPKRRILKWIKCLLEGHGWMIASGISLKEKHLNIKGTITRTGKSMEWRCTLIYIIHSFKSHPPKSMFCFFGAQRNG